MELEKRITITVDLPFTLVSGLMILAHILILLVVRPDHLNRRLEEIRNFHHPDNAIKIELAQNRQAPKIRTLGKKNGSKKNNVLVTPKNTPTNPAKPMDPFKAAAAMNKPFRPIQDRPQALRQPQERGIHKQPPTRPGGALQAMQQTRPSAIDQLTRTSRPLQEAAQNTTQMAGQATIANSPILSKSNVNMQVEVPEGVAADELNEYELMFYGFQKRMMEKYLSSIMLQVREYERRFPQKSLIPEGRHVMTGRVTFDSTGNIKQIKMVRWTQAQGLQDLFEDVLKSMNSVPNPPKKLWNKEGDFVVFYNLTVNNG